ncbi:hypothetical protein HMPREF0501_01265 [Limosilactobacillus coleohominis 101-4-CHN]|uniref:Uncharacterized protein n=1 Tax=Limosilactobacillus coleohominis 101-4-CHN TaxID=575594 RepID=C7XWY0_9LACO|nr:hypothetical protein HMPREF0501_01265 [Limosilactobacillus coleohominis 101-4-CHN]
MKNINLGRITKQGNSTIITTLIESAQGLVSKKAKKLKTRQNSQ